MSFYIEFEVIHHSEEHVEIRSLPSDQMIYHTKITLHSIEVPSQEIDSCSHVCVVWSSPGNINRQAFRVPKERGDSFTLLDIREEPLSSIYIEYMQVKDIFFRMPHIKTCVLMGDELYYFNDIKKCRFRFLCEKEVNLLDRAFYLFPVYFDILLDMLKDK